MLLPRLQSFQNDEIVADARAQLNVARLQIPIAAIHKNNLPSARTAERRLQGLRVDRPSAILSVHVHEHARFEQEPRVRKDDAHVRRSRVHVHLRIDEIHAALEGSARKGIHGKRRRERRA